MLFRRQGKSSSQAPMVIPGGCHGLSPNTPCPSEALPQPPMAWPVPEPFGSASDPPGSLAYFSLTLI